MLLNFIFNCGKIEMANCNYQVDCSLPGPYVFPVFWRFLTFIQFIISFRLIMFHMARVSVTVISVVQYIILSHYFYYS